MKTSNLPDCRSEIEIASVVENGSSIENHSKNAPQLAAQFDASGANLNSGPSAPEDDYTYRALAPSAVAAAGLAVFSLLAFFDWYLLVLPVLGIGFAIYALRQISIAPDELTGRPFALGGLFVSLLCLVGGASWQSYVYATELPEGHLRIGYDDLQPDEKIPGQIFPPSVEQLNNQQVFIKGYALAGLRQHGITLFVLVRDKGDCCFGGNPKLTDRILIHLKPGVQFDYTDRLLKIAGTFRLRPAQAVDVEGTVLYQIENAELR
ncbi:MAG: hypothetical protein SGJ20_15920 [Planctomycetota bacterium]|nr:hypothetical protein [Planctomycetota bacterium]